MSYWSFFREYWKPALVGMVVGSVLNIALSSFLGFSVLSIVLGQVIGLPIGYFLGMFGYWIFVKRKSKAA